MLDNWFKPKQYATVPQQRTTPEQRKATITEPDQSRNREFPDDIWHKCARCGHIQSVKDHEKNFKVCMSCGAYSRLNPADRIQFTLDEQSFQEYQEDMISVDPLSFPGYQEKYAKHQAKTGYKDAVVTGQGTIKEMPVIIACMNFEFFGGSMGSVVGEKIAFAIEQAIHQQLPLIIFSTSGGARMEESILSLMQMAKTSALLSRFAEENGLFISVLTDPTLGGVTASFAMLGDVIVAEPGAIVGFTGRRVIEQTIRQKLPENFQTAEFNLKHGQVDLVVSRKEMRDMLGKLLELHAVPTSVAEGS